MNWKDHDWKFVRSGKRNREKPTQNVRGNYSPLVK